jgi:allophanate hydrolase subunit 2
VALAAGQVLPVRTAAEGADEAGLFERTPPETGPIRFVPGPQDDWFAPHTVQDLAGTTYTLSARSDRMAYRLSGPALVHAKGHDIVSDGIAMGAIQVPGDGLPLVLMADRQPTGGYPKIGTVIRADLPRLAQMRPGQALRLAPVGVEAAVEALRAALVDAAGLAARLKAIRYVAGRGPGA